MENADPLNVTINEQWKTTKFLIFLANTVVGVFHDCVYEKSEITRLAFSDVL